MYIVAIGWAYVILMMAVTASSFGKAFAIFFFLGVLPLALFIYVADGSRRRRRRSMAVIDQVTDQTDSADTQSDKH
jgi:hypothetical protein